MKRLFYVLSAAVLLLSMALMTACGNNRTQGEEKYDVVVKVKNSIGDEWIFDLDADELTFEMEYTGEEVRFWADKYNLPDHPRWSESWPNFYVYGNDTIDMSCRYWDADGNQDRDSERSRNNKVLEKGKYEFTFHPDIYSQLFNWRIFTLFVIVY